VLLNTYYADAPTLRIPEVISLFADPAMQPWPGLWLKNRMWPSGSSDGRGNSSARRLRGRDTAAQVLQQFAGTPSTFPAFITLTSDLQATLQADTQRLPLLNTLIGPSASSLERVILSESRGG